MTINYANFRHHGTDNILFRCHEWIEIKEFLGILTKILLTPFYVVAAGVIIGEHFYTRNFLNNSILENFEWKTIELDI